jgi:transposase InsO family protein
MVKRLIRPLPQVSGLVADAMRTRGELVAENALLRLQLIVASRNVKRPAFQPHQRGFLVLLARLAPHWRDALLLVKPETVLKWHRAGFRLLWRHQTRADSRCESKLTSEITTLIRRMASENRLCGAERIRGELLKLGIRVSKRTIQKYIRAARPRTPRGGQTWRTFLRNHTVWACDFLETHDPWFRPIFAFFVMDINSKQLVYVAVTYNPSQERTAQQLRNATPFGKGPRFIIRDRDHEYGAEFDRAAKSVGTRVIRTAVRAPRMNSVVERFVRSAREECLDHLIIVGERHLSRVLQEFAFHYFNTLRPHQGLGQRIPVPTPRPVCSDASRVQSVAVLGGLHHDYRLLREAVRTKPVARTVASNSSMVFRP